ncbi:unnamed protein product [Cuscuta campestris]|uniref:Glutathione S-transferase n=1 Tax=Cuscuta campestris TaxID=132261 RepID=A0A484N427_9ASTE|nr:unnamed protein product [Cuscuta campestris]
MATTDDVKLLGTWWSPYALRVRIALNLKSVKYQFIEEPMWPKSELLLESNPVYRKVPVLIHNRRPIPESTLIAQYIDAVWASSSPPSSSLSSSSIFPSDPYHRATALFWSGFVDDHIFPTMRRMRLAADEGAKGEEMKKLLEELSQLEDVLLQSKGNNNKNNKFFGGERIGWLDIALGCFVGWFRAVEVSNDVKLFEGTPNLSQWAEDFAADDAVRGVLPSTEELVEFSEDFTNKLREAAGCR